jgi:hypothetical protein
MAISVFENSLRNTLKPDDAMYLPAMITVARNEPDLKYVWPCFNPRRLRLNIDSDNPSTQGR